MKIYASIAGIMLYVISSTVSAIPIGTTGGADDLVAWDYLQPSSSAKEQQFIADYLGVDASTVAYSQLSGSGGEDGVWMQVDEDSDLWAYDFGSSIVELFLIKGPNQGVGLVSDGTDDTFTHFLYENDDQFGVIDLSAFTRDKGNVEILMISHVGTVPEPAITALMGIGLVGMFLARRRVKT